jgi:hypothetical protein
MYTNYDLFISFIYLPVYNLDIFLHIYVYIHVYIQIYGTWRQKSLESCSQANIFMGTWQHTQRDHHSKVTVALWNK